MVAITVVSDLKPFKSMWKIRVKIIRLWKQYYVAGGLMIDMVLIDSNVGKSMSTLNLYKFHPITKSMSTLNIPNIFLSYK